LDEPIIKVEDVVKVYHTGESGVTALKGVSLEIFKGELAVIMGPSGSGKTTLLNLISGLDRPSSGRIFVLGREVNRMGEGELNRFRLRDVGIVFQFLNLITRLTARENIELPMIIAGNDRRYIDERVEYLSKKLDIYDKLDKMVEDLSGGEQQRVAIAAALANDPPILLADEPTAELDGENIKRVLSLFKELTSSGKTVVVNTHDPRVAREGTRVFLLEDGELKGIYRPRELASGFESSKGIAEFIENRLEEVRSEISNLIEEFRGGKIGVDDFIKRYNKLKTLEDILLNEFRIT